VDHIGAGLNKFYNSIMDDNFLGDDFDQLPVSIVKPVIPVVKKDTDIHMTAHEIYYNNGKHGPVQHMMMALGCAALTEPENCPYFQHTLAAILWSNTYVRSTELQEGGQNAQQLWPADLKALVSMFPEGIDRRICKWYLPYAPGMYFKFI
jgi:hypothetical protein